MLPGFIKSISDRACEVRVSSNWKKNRRIALALRGNSQRGTTELTFAHKQQRRIDYKGYIRYTGYMLKSYNFRHL